MGQGGGQLPQQVDPCQALHLPLGLLQAALGAQIEVPRQHVQGKVAAALRQDVLFGTASLGHQHDALAQGGERRRQAVHLGQDLVDGPLCPTDLVEGGEYSVEASEELDIDDVFADLGQPAPIADEICGVDVDEFALSVDEENAAEDADVGADAPVAEDPAEKQRQFLTLAYTPGVKVKELAEEAGSTAAASPRRSCPARAPPSGGRKAA